MSEFDKSFARELCGAHEKVLKTCRNITSRVYDAEDLAQTALERAWKARASFDPKLSCMSTWVIAIAINAFKDEYNASKRKKRTHKKYASTVQPPNQEDAAYLSQTIQAIKKLPRSQQDALHDMALEFSHSETAARKGLPLGTVKGRQRLARVNLARLGFN